ncbi:hypothetical protein DFP73DRAFT_288033 [Morchella snyderi]|nr:hypothetical protein DFP73DRAFT_288033 [Morchella snyderi]
MFRSHFTELLPLPRLNLLLISLLIFIILIFEKLSFIFKSRSYSLHKTRPSLSLGQCAGIIVALAFDVGRVLVFRFVGLLLAAGGGGVADVGLVRAFICGYGVLHIVCVGMCGVDNCGGFEWCVYVWILLVLWVLL